MKISNNTLLKYGNPVIASEIKDLESKLKSQLKATRTKKKRLQELTCEIASQKSYSPSSLKYVSQDDIELLNIVNRLAEKRYALWHGISVARGKAYAKMRSQNNKPQRAGAWL